MGSPSLFIYFLSAALAWLRTPQEEQGAIRRGDGKSGSRRVTSNARIQLLRRTLTHLALGIPGYALLVLKKILLQIKLIDAIQWGLRERETGTPVIVLLQVATQH